MVGTVSFNLDPPDGRAGAGGIPLETQPPPEVVTEREVEVGAAVPATPRLPFAPDPGSYTQFWTSQSATTTADEMSEDMESYIGNYIDANPDYNAIQTTILNSSDWMGFLMVLPGNQVVRVHSLGLFSSVGSDEPRRPTTGCLDCLAKRWGPTFLPSSWCRRPAWCHG
jgi:hypothetical protein